MGGGTDGGRIYLGGNEESDGVRAELVEEGGEEVHGLEGVDPVDASVELVVEGGDDEQDEVHQEADLLHPLASVVLVVDEEGWERISMRDRARKGGTETYKQGSSRRERRRH